MKLKHSVLTMTLCACTSLSCASLLVTDVEGQVNNDSKTPLSLLAEVHTGSKLSLETGAKLVLVDMSSGREYLLIGEGQYQIDPGGPRTLWGPAVVAKSLPANNLPPVRIATNLVAQGTLVMRNMRNVHNMMNIPLPISPVRTALLTTTPLLRWSPVEGATSYRVSISKQSEQDVRLFDTITKECKLALPDSAGLTAGGYYSWRIEAINEKEKIGDASTIIGVVSSDVADKLAQLKPDPQASYARRVLYAAELHQAGAVEEARALWQALAIERPGHANLQKLSQ